MQLLCPAKQVLSTYTSSPQVLLCWVKKVEKGGQRIRVRRKEKGKVKMSRREREGERKDEKERIYTQCVHVNCTLS